MVGCTGPFMDEPDLSGAHIYMVSEDSSVHGRVDTPRPGLDDSAHSQHATPFGERCLGGTPLAHDVGCMLAKQSFILGLSGTPARSVDCTLATHPFILGTLDNPRMDGKAMQAASGKLPLEPEARQAQARGLKGWLLRLLSCISPQQPLHADRAADLAPSLDSLQSSRDSRFTAMAGNSKARSRSTPERLSGFSLQRLCQPPPRVGSGGICSVSRLQLGYSSTRLQQGAPRTSRTRRPSAPPSVRPILTQSFNSREQRGLTEASHLKHFLELSRSYSVLSAETRRSNSVVSTSPGVIDLHSLLMPIPSVRQGRHQSASQRLSQAKAISAHITGAGACFAMPAATDFPTLLYDLYTDNDDLFWSPDDFM